MYNLLMNITNEMKLEIIHILKMKKFLGIEHISSINFTSQNSHTSILPNEMKSLEEYVNNCSLCTLYKSKESTFFSIGNENSDIFVIGLDYDFDDEKMFLIVKKMFENTLKININDIYMTNILKCKSKINKNNLDDEVAKCISYLEMQILILKPKMIITLGKSFEYIMKNNEKIINISGNIYNFKDIKLIPLLDPLFINQNPSYKEKMVKDLQKIKNILDTK
jgi:uracil-DNA glycosylase